MAGGISTAKGVFSSWMTSFKNTKDGEEETEEKGSEENAGEKEENVESWVMHLLTKSYQTITKYMWLISNWFLTVKQYQGK